MAYKLKAFFFIIIILYYRKLLRMCIRLHVILTMILKINLFLLGYRGRFKPLRFFILKKNKFNIQEYLESDNKYYHHHGKFSRSS